MTLDALAAAIDLEFRQGPWALDILEQARTAGRVASIRRAAALLRQPPQGAPEDGKRPTAARLLRNAPTITDPVLCDALAEVAAEAAPRSRKPEHGELYVEALVDASGDAAGFAVFAVDEDLDEEDHPALLTVEDIDNDARDLLEAMCEAMNRPSAAPPSGGDREADAPPPIGLDALRFWHRALPPGPQRDDLARRIKEREAGALPDATQALGD